MHVPDGFLDASTSIATGAVAAGAVGLALHRSRRELDESGTPLAGLVAVFVFAVQMVNFPVGAGTSGHLLGGALAAVLVGPWTAVLCLTVVLLVQALVFADGGLTALGTNITLLAVVTALVGYGVTRAVLVVLPRRPASVVPAAAVGAFASVPAAALVFVGLYALGGAVPVPLHQLTAAMVGWHLVIGAGEAMITAAVLGAVVATRPDLVHAARHLRPSLVLVDATGARTAAGDDAPAAALLPGGAVAAGEVPARGPARRPLAVGAAISLIVAGLVSLVASARPDGLEHVGNTLGFADSARDSAAGGGPLADYAVRGLDAVASTGLAGVAGVLAVAVVSALVLTLARRLPRSGRSGHPRQAGSTPAAAR